MHTPHSSITENGSVRRLVRDRTDQLARPILETDASGNVVRWFVWANGRLLAQVASNGVVRCPHFDEVGRLLAFTDNTGALTDEYAYQPYGRLIGHSGTTTTPFTWLGAFGVWDAGHGLYLTRHRAYDANLMRFVQADPLGISGGLNLYIYGSDNPLAFIDPSGLDAIYLLDSSAVMGQGHGAVAVGSDATFWTYYSFGSGTQVGTPDNYDVRNYRTLQELQADNPRYDLQIQYTATPEQDRTARQEGNSHYGDSYSLFTHNCDDVASDIIRASGQQFNDAWRPVQSYNQNAPVQTVRPPK